MKKLTTICLLGGLVASTLSTPIQVQATSVIADSDLLQATKTQTSVLNNTAKVNLATYQDVKPATGQIVQTGYQGLKTVAEYDKYLSQYAVEYNYAKKRKVILERTLVSRLGYDNIQKLSKQIAGVDKALDWLLSDENALELFIQAGDFYNGNGYNALVALTRLYQAYHQDMQNLTYKKMLLATAAAYSKNIKTFMVNYGGTATNSDPVVKYANFKWLYDNNRFVNKQQFDNYPMELVRYVMDAKMDDSEIKWLSDKLEHDYPNKQDTARLNGYTYVAYKKNYNYRNPEFYSSYNRQMWEQKYNLAPYNISYGNNGDFHLWMLLESGGICWGISGIGMNQAEVQGIPAVNTYQPGHEAYLLYQQNDQGQGIWNIWTDLHGWQNSYSRWVGINETQARLLMSWGNKSYNNLDSGNNTSYLLLAQGALNQFKTYKESMIYALLAQSYPKGSIKQQAAYYKALQLCDLNLDALDGLLASFASNTKTTDAQWLDLAQRIIAAYTYYPAPLNDLLNMLKPHFKDKSLAAKVEVLQQEALTKASQATAKDSLQPNACREVAKSLLGKSSGNLATFSFDGEHAGAIVLNDSYQDSQVMTRVSLDGGQTWEKFAGQDYSNQHIIQLSTEQLAKLNAKDGIVLGLLGTDATYKIDLKAGTSVGQVYANDQEDLLVGQVNGLEYSLNNGQTWQNYDATLNAGVRFTGNQTVLVRQKATGTTLAGPSKSFTFKASQDTLTSQYVPLKHLSVFAVSSQAKNNPATNFLDGNPNTSWTTDLTQADSQRYFSFAFDTPRYLSKIEYQSAANTGAMQNCMLYTSLDGQNWTLVKYFTGLKNDGSLQTLALDQSVKAKYVKLKANATYGQNTSTNNQAFSGSLLNVYEDLSK